MNIRFILALLISSFVFQIYQHPIANAESSLPNFDHIISNAQIEGQSWYMYVKAGEFAVARFEVTRMWQIPEDMGEIILVGPDGSEIQKIVVNKNNAQVGTVFQMSSPVANSDGVYKLSVKPIAPVDKYLTSYLADMQWTIGASSSASVDDIINGRVWSNLYNLPGQRNAGDLELFIATSDGYRYKVNYGSYNGWTSRIIVDQFGVRKRDTCESLRASKGSAAANRMDSNPLAQYAYNENDRCNGLHKIFFAEPENSLPESVKLPDGSITWLNTKIKPSVIENMKFTSAGDSSSPLKGKLTATVLNYIGEMVMEIDADGDGDYSGMKDRKVIFHNTGEQISVDFDGKDGEGVFVPFNKKVGIKLTASYKGEVHFTRNDVETNKSIRVERLNGSPVKRTWLFWNDFGLTESCGTKYNVNPADNRSGVDSSVGVHGWDSVGCVKPDGTSSNGSFESSWTLDQIKAGGDYGDSRVIDDWSYDLDSSVSEIIFYTAKEPQVVPDTPLAPNTGVETLNRVGFTGFMIMIAFSLLTGVVVLRTNR